MLPAASFGDLAVLGVRDAWLGGVACANDRCAIIVRHWDGKAWREVPVPAALANTPVGQGTEAVAATSASSAWVFAGRGAGSSAEYTAVLHWTGKGWAAPVRLEPEAISGAVATSATDVWAFGQSKSSSQPGYVAHFNGKTWTQQGLFPFIAGPATALSGSDIWVGGVTLGQSAGIEHWDGQVWRQTPVPRWNRANIVHVNGFAALAPGDVWADVTIFGTEPVPAVEMLHWNGTAWAHVAFPYAGGDITQVVSDGHGGIWVSDTGTRAHPPWLCHYSDGHWSRTVAPVLPGYQLSLSNLALIPGTRSIWAAGDLINIQSELAILKYGP